MADYAPNFTARYRIRYQTLNLQHTLQVRLPSTVLQTELGPYVTKLANFLSMTAPFRFTDWTVLGASFAPANSDVFLPAQIPTGIASGGVALPTVVTFSHTSLAFSWPGRSVLGHRGIIYLITTSTGAETAADIANARLTASENVSVIDSVNALNAAPSFVGNDNQSWVAYPYVNLKFNSYWNRRARG